MVADIRATQIRSVPEVSAGTPGTRLYSDFSFKDTEDLIPLDPIGQQHFDPMAEVLRNQGKIDHLAMVVPYQVHMLEQDHGIVQLPALGIGGSPPYQRRKLHNAMISI